MFCVLFLAGCQKTQERNSLAAQIEQLTQEKKLLQEQVEQSQAENKQLKGQVQVLSGLPEAVKLENLSRLRSVKIGRYTGFYDKDNDGRKEKLIVYIQPMDEEGDKIKAAGDVDVQLWDLSKTESGALLGQWHVAPNELKKLWFDTVLTINYRLTFDVPGKIDPDALVEDSLTVKVTFTDYLTGQVFNEQKAIKPASP
jgi:cell division protein FtsB